jgi:hypothetical protein
VGVTKLLDSLESTKQHLARLLTGAGAAPPKEAAGRRRVTRRPRVQEGRLRRSSSVLGGRLAPPRSVPRNGPSSKCARRTRTCMKKGLGD